MGEGLVRVAVQFEVEVNSYAEAEALAESIARPGSSISIYPAHSDNGDC